MALEIVMWAGVCVIVTLAAFLLGLVIIVLCMLWQEVNE